MSLTLTVRLSLIDELMNCVYEISDLTIPARLYEQHKKHKKFAVSSNRQGVIGKLQQVATHKIDTRFFEEFLIVIGKSKDGPVSPSYRF